MENFVKNFKFQLKKALILQKRKLHIYS
jgi:hypothetical protein